MKILISDTSIQFLDHDVRNYRERYFSDLKTYMAGHMFNPSYKLENPTPIRSWVMSSNMYYHVIPRVRSGANALWMICLDVHKYFTFTSLPTTGHPYKLYKAQCGNLKRRNLKCNVQWIIPVIKFRSFYFTSCANVFLPAALRAAQICRYLVYSEADFEVFRRRSPPPCQISPPSVQRQGCRTPKIENFTQIWPKCGI